MKLSCLLPQRHCYRILIPLFLLMLITSLSAQTLTSQTDNKQDSGPRKTILFLGNSLTAGYGLDPDQAYPAIIQEKIDTLGLDYTVINAGLSGETSAGGIRRLNWLLRTHVDVLVLSLGANDGLRGFSPKLTEGNLDEIIRRVEMKYPGVKVIVAGMEALPNMGEVFVREFRAVFPRLAQQRDAELIPFLLEGVAGDPALNLPDGIHPNVRGQKIVAENVWIVLKPLLAGLNKTPPSPAQK